MCQIETDGIWLYLGPTSGKGFGTVENGLYLMKHQDIRLKPRFCDLEHDEVMFGNAYLNHFVYGGTFVDKTNVKSGWCWRPTLGLIAL